MTEQIFKPGKNRITFQSEGKILIGHLYLPESYESGDEISGIIVGGSWTTVKEQMAGLYAQKLAEKGYAALAFDHRYYGESEGEPRFFENPEAKTRDFINAMNYLEKLLPVDSGRIGGLAVCASGGYMADAVARDDRFKAFAAVVPWFNTDEVVHAFYGGKEGIQKRIEEGEQAFKTYEKEGEAAYVPTVSETDTSAAMYGPFNYYLDEDLGNIPNWSDDKFAVMSWEPWLNYRPVPFAEQITVPTLIITSEEAATPAAAEEFYNKINGPKDLVWLEGGQLDFYHKPKLVNKSLDHVVDYFKKYLN